MLKTRFFVLPSIIFSSVFVHAAGSGITEKYNREDRNQVVNQTSDQTSSRTKNIRELSDYQLYMLIAAGHPTLTQPDLLNAVSTELSVTSSPRWSEVSYDAQEDQRLILRIHNRIDEQRQKNNSGLSMTVQEKNEQTHLLNLMWQEMRRARQLTN